ncbi:hypothetical protein RvY_15877 [Ramazzottius varieornatus]|uniref:SUI1 domain-containing protein n=1 Tax=Ramazzottius varieornatus TaxID=947166 RepID=A0A1D1VWG8_RAMVA|nr:hypothetical protein RvY_15877 [Ramazzottius varieornatus]
MFKRPLKIKSQSSVKKTERKSLFGTLSLTYKALADGEKIRLLFPDGEEIKILNVSLAQPAATTSGPSKNDKPSIDSFTIYCDGTNQPLFFAFDVPKTTEKTFERIILPTVYALWKVPNLLRLSFATIPDVITKMQNGADLMLAGTTVPESTRQSVESAESTRPFGYASVLAIGNNIPIGVGQLLMGREELAERLAIGGEMKGRVLKALHTAGDELWALGDKSGPRDDSPSIEPSNTSNTVASEAAAQPIATSSDGDAEVTAADMNEQESGSTKQQESGEPITEESPDNLLTRSFLTTLKSNALPEKYPMLDSILNALMLVTSRRLSSNPMDIKQTSFRKFSTFLKHMETQKVLTLVKVKEGVQAVDSVVWKHPLFDGIIELPYEPTESSHKSLRIPSSVRQVYIVNGKTLPLFSAVSPDIRKGYEFRSTDDLKALVSQYIKSRDLMSKTDKGIINLDPLLVDLVMNKSMRFQGEWPMKWGELFDKILKEMSTTHEVVFTNGASVELKGNLVPLEVKVEKKAGNKLVTVIRNLEGLGMDPQEIARELQKMVGATVGVREEGGAQKTAHCVTIQGDQTKLLDKFFFQIVSIPKKFVTGLDKPGKKG